MRIAITGGTGLVGGHLAAALSAAGHEAVVIARGKDDRAWAGEVLSMKGVTFRAADIGDPASLERAFAGCEAVAHCAGINRELGSSTYESVHVVGTRTVVDAAERAGVDRLALVSFLRARPNCGSAYHESKWAAEEIVRASDLEWTVLKPGMMFGRGDHMLDHLSKALLTFPVYLGVGDRRVRPLAVEDAVRVLIAALVHGSLMRKTVPIMGPTEIGFDAAVRLVGDVLGRRRPTIRVPIAVHYLLARITERLMTVPLVATAQVRILQEGLVEPTLAPDRLPGDLMPGAPFDEEGIRSRLPAPLERFGLRDLRPFARRRVFVCGEGEQIIERDPRAVIEFVLDVERYRRADHKIGPVRWIKRDGNRGQVRHGGRFMGLPAPAVTLGFELTPFSRIDFKGVEMPWPLKGFDGFFSCEPVEGGTRVVHRECLIFGPIAGPLLKPLVGPGLSRDTPAEVHRIKTLLESEGRG